MMHANNVVGTRTETPAGSWQRCGMLRKAQRHLLFSVVPHVCAILPAAGSPSASSVPLGWCIKDVDMSSKAATANDSIRLLVLPLRMYPAMPPASSKAEKT
jgi:hypothetical protein